MWISQKDFAKAASMDVLIIAFGVVFGVLLFLASLLGWCTGCKENRCLLFFVQTLMLIRG